MLFDKDGTLVDFRTTWVPAYLGVAAELAAMASQPTMADRLLAHMGYRLAEDAFDEASPLLWATNVVIARHWSTAPGLGGIDVLEVVERHFNDLERYPPRPVGDVAALFGRLRRHGLKVGLATMDSLAPTRATAALLGITPALDFLACCDSGHGVKPEPGMVLAFCAACGLEPAEVAMVGDTPADLTMGRAAGCGLVVGVLTGGAPASSLVPLADHVVASIMDLEPLLGSRIS
ncbi:MAG TPA: HAD family hydrolase [Geminicoccaceae bacterium]|nr:HAD family hydrolase [Geminicoccus sp.]HMU50746.1 HAD family hydrolase [Geminicoccaceae bacterium]